MSLFGAKRKAYLGMDLGGSNLYSVAFDAQYNPIFHSKIDTEAREGYLHVIDRVALQIQELKKRLEEESYELEGIGLGVPGLVQSDHGSVLVAPNLGWSQCKPVRDMDLPQELKERTILLNDVNAGLLGELNRMDDDPVCAVAYFCGTGIGGAVALGGKLLEGKDGAAGEVGHMVVRSAGRKCGCGRQGCLEAYIGKWALNAQILKALDAKKKTRLKSIINYNLKKQPVKSSSLKKAYEKGDGFTVELMEEHYAGYLAVGISQTANFLAPDCIVLGGGIMEAMGEYLLPVVRNKLESLCMGPAPRLQLAVLGDLAGPLGAAIASRS
ncbi:MAG: ROK family protein [Leptospiraceae bacterium]